MFDHFSAVARAIAAKVQKRALRSEASDVVGGATLTFETSGAPGLATFLRIDRPGLHFFPQAGTLFQAFAGGFLGPWSSAPSSVAVTVPPSFAGLYHAQMIVLDGGAIAFSNYVPLAF